MADTHSIYIKVDSTETNKAATNLNNMEKATNGAEKALSSLTRAAVGLVALDKIGGLAKGIIETNMAMESLRAQLVSVTGSAIGAQKAFKFIQDFATSTPYEIDGLTKSYIALQNYGIKPTKQVMEAVTNQASKLGASQETLDGIVRALGQAYAKGKLQAEEMLQLAERGVPVYDLLSQVTGKNAAQLQEMASKGQLTRDVLEKLIDKMGELASGANANAMETLSGKISNLSDAWHQFEDALLNDKSEGLFKNIVDGITAQVNKLTASLKMSPVQELERQIGILSQNKGYDVPIAELQKKLDAAKQIEAEQAKITSEQMKQEDVRVAKAEEARKKLLDGGGQIVTSKKQQTAATKALNDAESAFNATIQANISAAQNQGTIQDAQIKTAEKRLQAELDAAKVQAQYAMDASKSDEERMKIQEDLAAKSEEIIVKETELRQQQITIDEQVLAARISGLEQELAASDKFNASQSERIRLETQIQALKAQQQVIPEARAQVEIQATQDLQAAYTDLNDLKLKSVDTEKAVRDEALRTLEVMSSNLEYAQSMAKGLAEAFGAVGQSIGDVAVAMANYEKQMATIEVQKNEQLEKAKGDPKKRQQAEETAALKVAQTQIKAYGDMAQAAQGFFKKGTAGYNALGAAVKVFRAFEMAQSAISMVKQIGDMGSILQQFIGMETAKTAEKVASNAVQESSDAAGAVTSATKAVADAGQGDPYTGIIRAAAMLAFMAAIGIAIGGSGSASAQGVTVGDVQKAQDQKFNQQNATMLGSSELSKSILNSLDIIAENSSNNLDFTRGMAANIQRMADSMSSIGTLATKKVTFDLSSLNLGTSSSTNGSNPLSALDPISAALFGGTKTNRQFVGKGIEIFSQSLQSIIDSGTINAKKYADVLTTKQSSAFFGLFKSTSQNLEREYKKLDPELNKAFAKTFESMKKTIIDGASLVGETINAEGLKTKGVSIKIGKDQAKNQELINAALSAQADIWVTKTMPQMLSFQKANEGLFETMVRVTTGASAAKDQLAFLGMESIKYTEIKNKEGDVGAEMARQTIIAQSNLSKETLAYIENLKGSATEIIASYVQLNHVSQLYSAVGISTSNLGDKSIIAANGVDNLQQSLESYFENFFSKSEHTKFAINSMRFEFEKFGLTMPKTRDEFKQLVNSLSVDPAQQARLLTLAPAFNDMINSIDELNSSFVDLFKNITGFQDSINSQIASLTSVTATAELSATNLQKAYHNLFEAVGLIGDKVTGSQSEIDLLSAVKGAIMDRYNSEMARLKEVAQAQAEALRAGLQQQIDAINASVTAQVDAINSATESQIASINSATEAEVSAINARLDAEIQARQAAHEEALKGLQNELEAANKLKSAIQQVRDYAKSLNLSSSAPLSPEARLAESQRQYQDLLRRAQGGDAEAISQLSGASQSYLDAARQYFGSGTQYTNIFDGVKQAMEQIGAMSAPDPDSIQSHIDDLRKSQSDELAQLREAAQNQIKATQDAAKDHIKSLQDSAKDQIKAIQDAAKDQIKAVTDDVNQAIQDLTNIDKNPAMKALKDDTISQLQGLSDISEKVREEADKQAEAAKKILEDQREYQKNQTDFMERVADAVAPTSGTSKQEEIMNNMVVEQRALVTAQSNANPQIIENLASVDARLAKIERNLRLLA